MSLRFNLPHGDVPASAMARHMGLTLEQFEAKLPELLGRNFPAADPTTGNFCVEAVDLWRTRARYPHLFPLDRPAGALNARDVVAGRVARLRG